MLGNASVIELIARVRDETGSGVTSATAQVDKMEQAFNKAQAGVDKLFKKNKLEISLTAIDGASKILSGVWDKGTKIAGKVFSFTLKAIDLVTAPLQGIFKMLTNPLVEIAGLAGIGLGAKDTIDTFMNFEAEMSRVKAIAGATGAEFELLNQQAKDLGASTAFSASEVAFGMENLAAAGFSTNEIMAAMPGMLDLAASSGEDLASSAEIAGTILRGFGLDAGEAGHVADVLAKSAADTNSSVKSLGDSMKYIAPIANNVGWSLESVTAALGIMADAGIKGEQGGTTLRGALSRLEKPTKAVNDQMQALGFSAYDNNGKFKSLSAIVASLSQSTKKLSDEDKNFVIATIFGTEALSGMQILLDAGADKLEEYEEALKHADGAADEMARTMQDNLKGSFEEMGGAAETLKISIGERLAPHLRNFANWVTEKMPGIQKAAGEAFDWIDKKIASVKKTIEEMTGSAAWQNAATIWDKLKIAWDRLVVDPFEAWWNSSGKDWINQKAADIGGALGKGLNAAIMGILGAGDALGEAKGVAGNFASAFMEGFEADKVGKAIADAIGEALKAHPIIAAVFGLGVASKAVTGVGSVVNAGKTLFGVGSSAAGVVGASGAIGATGAAGAGATGVAGAGIGAAAGLAASVAGVAFATAGVASALGDWYAASKTYNSKLDEKISSGIKGSSVLLGGIIGNAILPGIGAAVGAGIGGIVGLVAGSPIGKAIESWVDGTAEIDAYTKELGKVSKAYEDIADKTSKTKALIKDLFSAPEGETENSATAREKSVIDELMRMYPNILHQRDLENGKFEEKLALIERINAAELQGRTSEIKQTVEEGRGKFDEMTDQINEWNALNDKHSDTSDKLTDLEIQLMDYQSFRNESMDEYGNWKSPELQEQGQAEITRLNALLNDNGIKDMGHMGDTAFGVTQAIKNVQDANNQLTADISENQAKIDKYIKDFETYYNAELDLMRIDYADKNGGDDLTTDLAKYLQMTTDLTENGAVWGKEQKDLYLELGNRLSPVISQIDDLNVKFGQIPEDKQVNIHIMTTDEYTRIEKINRSYEIMAENEANFAVDNANRREAVTRLGETKDFSAFAASMGIPGNAVPHAEGGILSSAHYGLVAEDGPEAIIPLSGGRRSRGIELWEEAGQRLGMNLGLGGASDYSGSRFYPVPHAEGGIFENPYAGIPSIGLNSSPNVWNNRGESSDRYSVWNDGGRESYSQSATNAVQTTTNGTTVNVTIPSISVENKGDSPEELVNNILAALRVELTRSFSNMPITK